MLEICCERRAKVLEELSKSSKKFRSEVAAYPAYLPCTAVWIVIFKSHFETQVRVFVETYALGAWG